MLISALINGRSISAETLNHIMDNFVLLSSSETWGELEAKLYSQKLSKYWDDEARTLFLVNLATQA